MTRGLFKTYSSLYMLVLISLTRGLFKTYSSLYMLILGMKMVLVAY